MNKLYGRDRAIAPILQWILTFLCGAAYFVCCLPSFYRVSGFLPQTAVSLLLTICVSAAFFFVIPRSLLVLGKGLSLFLIGMLVFAIIHQIQAHLQAQSTEIWWIHTFFYDRIYTVSLVWFVPFAAIVLLRLLLPPDHGDERFRADFASFFSTAFRTFLMFYGCVMIYCFFLQRKPGEDSGFNLIPFSMIISYFQTIHVAYENNFYLLGNLLCFFPFGFYYAVSRNSRPAITVIGLPIVLSLLIEVTQLLFQTGHFDVDDIIMNALSFYAGYGIERLFDYIRIRVTKGEERSIFVQNSPAVHNR